MGEVSRFLEADNELLSVFADNVTASYWIDLMLFNETYHWVGDANHTVSKPSFAVSREDEPSLIIQASIRRRQSTTSTGLSASLSRRRESAQLQSDPPEGM